MFLKLLIGLCVLVCVVNCDECDKSKCQPIPKHYKELGCTAVVEEGKCCPSRFNCPNFAERDNTKCYFRGLTYDLHDGPDTTVTSSLCSAGCRCMQSYSDPNVYNFNCAQIECPELFNANLRDCVAVRSKDSCCASDYICDEEKKSKVGKCHFQGKEYRVGDKMYPNDAPCHSCLCTDDFDNSPVIGNKDCSEVDCGVELRSLSRVISGCIPIYYGTARCCPIGWKCPESNDKIIENESRQVVDDTNMTCKYGDKILKLGDTITDSNKCVDCKCLVPPMAHCIQRKDC